MVSFLRSLLYDPYCKCSHSSSNRHHNHRYLCSCNHKLLSSSSSGSNSSHYLSKLLLSRWDRCKLYNLGSSKPSSNLRPCSSYNRSRSCTILVLGKCCLSNVWLLGLWPVSLYQLTILSVFNVQMYYQVPIVQPLQQQLQQVLISLYAWIWLSQILVCSMQLHPYHKFLSHTVLLVQVISLLPRSLYSFFKLTVLVLAVQPTYFLPVQQPQTLVSVPTPQPPPTPATCEWSEHTSPEGYKYYYNGSSGESKVPCQK